MPARAGSGGIKSDCKHRAPCGTRSLDRCKMYGATHGCRECCQFYTRKSEHDKKQEAGRRSVRSVVGENTAVHRKQYRADGPICFSCLSELNQSASQ
jgi:hypothetical protein